MEKYYHSYDLSYERFTPEWFDRENQESVDRFLNENAESMINFLESYFKQFNIDKESLRHKNILVTGCGFGGLCHYFARMGADVTGIDVAALAIVGAKDIAKNKGLFIRFKQMDVCQDNLDEKFDLIIDDHLLHCLTTKEDRDRYLGFIKNHLNPGGLFLVETMAFQSKLQTPIGYYLDEDSILWQHDFENKKEFMTRKIATSMEIENEILNSGLHINYLYYHSELAFHVFPEHSKYPMEYLPRTIRLSAVNNA